MANSSGGGKFGNRFRQTAGQVRKEIEFKNALMRHLAEKCAAVENESNSSEDELTAKDGLQIEASRDELLAQLEADEETRKFRERQALSHAVHNQHMELLLRRSLEEVRQKRKVAADGAKATDESTDTTENSSTIKNVASNETVSNPPNDAVEKNKTVSDEINRAPDDNETTTEQPIPESSPYNDVTDASSQKHSTNKPDVGIRKLSGGRRAVSVEEGNVERRIKLAQTRNNSFGQTPTPPNR